MSEADWDGAEYADDTHPVTITMTSGEWLLIASACDIADDVVICGVIDGDTVKRVHSACHYVQGVRTGDRSDADAAHAILMELCRRIMHSCRVD